MIKPKRPAQAKRSRPSIVPSRPRESLAAMTVAKLYGTPAKGEGTRTSPIEIDSDVDNKAKAGPSRSPQVQRREWAWLYSLYSS